MSVKDFEDARKKHARIIVLQLAGATEPAIIHDIDWDVVTQEPLHVDFQRVNMNEKIVVEVPIKTKGPSKGEAEGGILVLQMGQVKVRCLPLDIPERSRSTSGPLLVHESVKVKELVLPAGIEAGRFARCARPLDRRAEEGGAAGGGRGRSGRDGRAGAHREGAEGGRGGGGAAADAAGGAKGARRRRRPLRRPPAKEKKPEKK